MKISLVQFTSEEIKNESKFLVNFSDDLMHHFDLKNYGNDIIEIVIGIICVSTYFEPFFIPRKPKYIKDKKTKKSSYTNTTYEIEKCFSYDIKVDFDAFKNATNINGREKLLATEIINSLNVVEGMKNKFKDFNLDLFSTTLENYFKEKGYLE